jgi:hypothetical protein
MLVDLIVVSQRNIRIKGTWGGYFLLVVLIVRALV